MSNISQRARFEDERYLIADDMDSTYQNIGSPLQYNPVIIILDNQTDVEVPLSVTGNSTWKTFSPGEALVLDLRAAHGIASNYTIDVGTQFSTNADQGTEGAFRISILSTR